MACNSYIWYPYLTLTIIVRLDGHKISYSVAYAFNKSLTLVEHDLLAIRSFD